MKKIIKTITVVVISLSVLLLLTSPASAENGGRVVYENDFSNSTLDETMWYVKGGTAKVVSEYNEKFLRCTSIVGTSRKVEISFGPEEAKNVDISLRMRATDTNTNTAARMGIYFRSATIPASENFAYQLRLNESGASIINYNLHFDTQSKILAEDFETKIRAGLWNNVKICLREERIVIYVNGNIICDFKDDIYTAEGGFGICGERYTFDVDDIVMVQYKDKNLPEPTPNDAPLWVGKLGTDEKLEKIDTGNERFNPLSDTVEKVINIATNDNGKLSVVGIIILSLLALVFIGVIVILILLIKENKKTKAAATDAKNIPEKEGDKQ